MSRNRAQLRLSFTRAWMRSARFAPSDATYSRRNAPSSFTGSSSTSPISAAAGSSTAEPSRAYRSSIRLHKKLTHWLSPRWRTTGPRDAPYSASVAADSCSMLGWFRLPRLSTSGMSAPAVAVPALRGMVSVTPSRPVLNFPVWLTDSSTPSANRLQYSCITLLLTELLVINQYYTSSAAV